MDRRSFLQCSLVGGGFVAGGLIGAKRIGGAARAGFAFRRQEQTPALQLQHATQPLPPVHSITPIVGDGRWIWNEPPDETGYLDPRTYELEIGIHLKGTGRAQLLKATTPLPVQLPEQKIDQSNLETLGCRAAVRFVAAEAAQLMLVAPSIARGQAISAVASMRLTLRKQYQGFAKEQFDGAQPEPPLAFRRQYLLDSPGIQTRARQVRKLQQQITGYAPHAWDKAQRIYQWVWDNIQAKVGIYTSVVRALRSRIGDCEERAACFVALCRSAGIPARLVWVPNHNWAEFYLVDSDNQGHWIPAHTAAYSWFGWTGAHELVIQKGDNLVVPEKRGAQRLLADWMQWQGARPEVRYSARIRPLPSQSGEDAGPGERIKDERGKWALPGSHRLDAVLRDGRLSRSDQYRSPE